MAAFDLAITHVPGSRNVVADALSRPPMLTEELHDVSREHVMDAIRVWLGTVAPHLSPEDCVAACVASLGADRKIAVLRCPECTALHLDCGVYATRKHTVHVCNKCSHRYRTAPASQGNPLGVLSPVLR